MRRLAFALVTAATFLLPSLGADPAVGEPQRPVSAREIPAIQIESVIRRDLARRHLPTDLLDVAATARRLAEAKATQGLSSQRLSEMLSREIFEALYASGTPGAKHAPTQPYRMPFDVRFPRYLAAGSGDFLHQGFQEHALDITLPQGEPILAARGGEVALVIDGFGPGAHDPEFSHSANKVQILHDDGTLASYVHLLAGIRVRPGQRVRTGDVIGRAGKSGYAALPHLHFAVFEIDAAGAPRSVRVQFGQGEGFFPEPGQRYGWLGKSPETLRVEAADRSVAPGDFVPLAEGDSVELRVWLRTGSGWREVSRSSALRYSSLAPEGFRVDRGVVTALPDEGFEPAAGTTHYGFIRVLYERGNRVGYRDVGFLWPGRAPGDDRGAQTAP